MSLNSPSIKILGCATKTAETKFYHLSPSNFLIQWSNKKNDGIEIYLSIESCLGCLVKLGKHCVFGREILYHCASWKAHIKKLDYFILVKYISTSIQEKCFKNYKPNINNATVSDRIINDISPFFFTMCNTC